jgi:hypothetical protein
MEGAAYWLALYELLSLLSFRTQDHQRRDGSNKQLGLRHQSLIKKMPYRLAYSGSYVGIFSLKPSL